MVISKTKLLFKNSYENTYIFQTICQKLTEQRWDDNKKEIENLFLRYESLLRFRVPLEIYLTEMKDGLNMPRVVLNHQHDFLGFFHECYLGLDF